MYVLLFFSILISSVIYFEVKSLVKYKILHNKSRYSNIMNFKAMAKTNNEREQNHLPKNNINDIKSQTYAKKIKKNKYSQFSKNKEDPLEVALKEADEREKQSKFDISAPIRGTTVPTIAASPAIKRRNGNTDNNGNFSHQGNEKTVDFTKFKSIVPSESW